MEWHHSVAETFEGVRKVLFLQSGDARSGLEQLGLHLVCYCVGFSPTFTEIASGRVWGSVQLY